MCENIVKDKTCREQMVADNATALLHQSYFHIVDYSALKGGLQTFTVKTIKNVYPVFKQFGTSCKHNQNCLSGRSHATVFKAFP